MRSTSWHWKRDLKYKKGVHKHAETEVGIRVYYTILKKKEINSYLTESRYHIFEKWRRIKDV